MDDDWRLAGNEHLFHGAEFTRKQYVQWSPTWDHDHCAFCWATFEADGQAASPDAIHEGYATPGPPMDPTEDYYWVCPGCFEDFRVRLDWRLRPTTPTDPTNP